MTSFIVWLGIAVSVVSSTPSNSIAAEVPEEKIPSQESPTETVPFYSQFKDIASPSWKKIGCGIASLAMIIDYYKPAVPVNSLLNQGIAAGAYLNNAGWTYKGLISLGAKYGLSGTSHDLWKKDSAVAFAEFKKYLESGPLMASVHYKFDPKSKIPHLVVINRLADGVLYYNDPAAKSGEQKISVSSFLKAWKKRFIVLRPKAKAA